MGGSFAPTERGRFAPSPTGDLHLGNLRTALVSWLCARTSGGEWIVRMEDLDRMTSSSAHAAAQLRSLDALGLHWDGPVLHQSQRFDWYRAAIAELGRAGLVYECFCTRREIRDAASAPHAPDDLLAVEGAYPGTCRALSVVQRRRHLAAGRRPALRLRTDGERIGFTDLVAGHITGAVDDVVLQRNDGVPAYNVAVVVDDAVQGVTQVVRGNDLLGSTARQILLQRLLGLATPQYAHIALVVGRDGQRLAKRHGAVTLTDLAARGIGPAEVLVVLAASLGMPSTTTVHGAADLLELFDIGRIPAEPWRATVAARLAGTRDAPGGADTTR